MKPKPTQLNIYWDDGVTIECRRFDSRKDALKYAREHCHGMEYRVMDR